MLAYLHRLRYVHKIEERKMKKERKIHTGVEKYIISVMLICSSPLTVFKILALHNLVRNLLFALLNLSVEIKILS